MTLDEFLASVKANGAINGTWKLETVDTETSAPSSPNFVNFWSLNLSTGRQIGSQVNLTPEFINSTVAAQNQYIPIVLPGSATQNFSTSAPSSPVGIGPNLVMAADNTLGSFSPYEGRIYAAFVGYYNIKIDGYQNPASNTDIFLEYSDDAGRSWVFAGAVNNLSSQTDGYSESLANPDSTDQVTGRTQFMPTIAVDQSTGTVVVAYRDASYDASNARTATDVVTSIDGGNTWSPVTYVNPQQTAIDAITGKTVVIGPMTDNQSGDDGQRDGTYGYGNQMGLTVNDGQILVAWAGNFNQATIVSGAVTGDPLNIWLRTLVIASGPRIVNSTMGPVPTITDPSTGQVLDGFQQATQLGQLSFTVTYDRPINPPSLDGYTTTPSFTPADVQVFYHDTTNGDPSIPVLVTGVTPVASSGVGPNNKFGFTEFTVTFDPTQAAGGGASGIQNFTGTYSYIITPDDGQGTPIVSPIASYVNVPAAQPVIGPVAANRGELQPPHPQQPPSAGPAAPGRPRTTRSRRSPWRATPTSSSPGSPSTCRSTTRVTAT